MNNLVCLYDMKSKVGGLYRVLVDVDLTLVDSLSLGYSGSTKTTSACPSTMTVMDQRHSSRSPKSAIWPMLATWLS
ncbi:hypothetical protein [Enterobacter phage EspM4VN]|uniref:Uncharacterized protein n=1 Tax=Enterobacter phage EspM4VN TaxID=2137745 RepID=A0A4P2WVL5_9CAUD|nr:hypothetical protein HYP11_gp080 [Enterobacter phage EspM4VN]BBK03754.1 hypothetical protein [Enterobacter phage EspM4VN]